MQIAATPDIELEVLRVVQAYLGDHPGQSRPEIYDNVIKRMFSRVQLESFDLDAVLKLGEDLSLLKRIGDGWYATGARVTSLTDDGGRGQGSLFDKQVQEPVRETIAQLTQFLEAEHAKGRRLIPYSELRDFYIRKVNLPLPDGVSYDELVASQFKVERDRVRLMTEAEAAEARDIEAKFKRRNITRYLVGDLKRIPTDVELADWIEFAYGQQMYREGAALAMRLNVDALAEEVRRRLEKIIKVCKLKASVDESE